MNRLEIALSESVKIQSHYAVLLNMYDGGKRLEFKNIQEWMDRLAKVGILQSENSQKNQNLLEDKQ